MKKIVTLLLITISTIASFAQDAIPVSDVAKKFRFGLKAAPSVCWLKPDDTRFERGKTVMKFGYGLITEFRINDIASFLTGLEVTYAGGGLNYTDSVYRSLNGKDYLSDPATAFLIKKREYKLQYINVPLSLKMKTKEIGLMAYYGQFGFDLGVRAKARATDTGYLNFTNNKSTLSSIAKVEAKQDVGLFRVALNIGLGVEYGLVGSTVLVAGVNYSNGFTNTLKKNSPDLRSGTNAAITQKATSNFISLTVGVIF